MIKKIITTVVLIIIVMSALWIYKNSQPEISQIPSSPVVKNYDTSLSTTYIKKVGDVWPPAVTTIESAFICKESPLTSQERGTTTLKEIQGVPYCVTVTNEGAAGSTYRTYIYSSAAGEKTLSTTFTLQSTECMNYDNPQQSECLEERKNFDSDILAYNIIENNR